ncbi:hypothetical protein Dimus_001684 [Dionaea muscipula]
MRIGLVDKAQKLFDEMPHRNTVTWNAMIRGYFQNGQFDDAINMFQRMPTRDIFSYNTVICGLMRCGNVAGAKELFECMAYRDVVTWNSMISGYIRNGLIDEAVLVFNTMPEKDIVSGNLVMGGLLKFGQLDSARKLFYEMTARDVVSWTVMISGLVEGGHIVEGRKLFEQMPIKDSRAWNTIIVGCVEHGDTESARLILKRMAEPDFNSLNALISWFLRNKRMSDAVKFFFELPNKCQKLWNSVLLGLIRNGLIQEAHAYSVKNPLTDVVSSTNFIVGYCQTGDVEAAVRVFELMPIRDTAAWNATIFGLGENNHGEEGLKLFIQMRESGQYPDVATFTSILKLSSYLSSLYFGKQAHGLAIRMGLVKFTPISNALVTMYARCGDMGLAMLEFTSMPTHDIISWNSIICGFSHQGSAENALEMFNKMTLTDVQPNQITFVGVLSAVSYAGLVDEGKWYFHLMRYKYLIQPTTVHYTCVVDLLGRHGLIGEAVAFLDLMKDDGIDIPVSVWGALLGACRMHNNTKLGEIAGKRVLEEEPHNSGVYLILAEMYANQGRTKDAERILIQMKERRVKKQPGCSWIELKQCGIRNFIYRLATDSTEDISAACHNGIHTSQCLDVPEQAIM